MTPDESARLDGLAQYVGIAAELLRRELPQLEEFIVERPEPDSARRAALAMLRPIFAAAREFVTSYDLAVKRAKAALAAVNAR